MGAALQIADVAAVARRAERVVYHYTDTARLPWILVSGALKPGRNRIGGFPDPDFLWATTSPVGDRTASASLSAMRSGRVRLVRFPLSADAFRGWPEATEPYPAWTAGQVRRLEDLARGKSDPTTWRCRAEPLAASEWVAIETRGFVDKTWRPISPAPWSVTRFQDDTCGVQIGRKIYASSIFEGPFGSVGYAPVVHDTDGASAPGLAPCIGA